MKIKELLEGLEYTLLQGDPETEIYGISHDNRKIRSKDAFICIKGARFDTHDLVSDIAKKGAALILVEKETELPENTAVALVKDTRAVSPCLAAAFYHHPASKLVTIGITGSKGKTTTTHMLADILRCAGFLTGTIGTNGAIMPKKAFESQVLGAGEADAIDCAETPGYDCYELSNTTPDAMEVQMYLAMMVEAGCTHAVVEVSSQGMKQHRTDGFIFDYAIWTNIETGDHIGPNEHKDFEEYLTCKAMLMNHSRTCFINRDDKYCDDFLKHVNRPDGSQLPKEIYFYGSGENADYRGYALKKHFDEEQKVPGITFLTDGIMKEEIRVNLPGDFNLYNALAAICAANRMKIDAAVINEALTHLHIRGRFDIVYSGMGFQVCVDFAHNGYSTRNHLKALREYLPKRLVCVFGADGNRSKYRRYEMGEASALLADLSIVTAGHNRFETFEQIMEDIQKGIDKADLQRAEEGKEKAEILVIPNRREAIRYAIDHAQKGDMITILGLGHESYQEENGVKYPHSDIAFSRECCLAREAREKES